LPFQRCRVSISRSFPRQVSIPCNWEKPVAHRPFFSFCAGASNAPGDGGPGYRREQRTNSLSLWQEGVWLRGLALPPKRRPPGVWPGLVYRDFSSLIQPPWGVAEPGTAPGEGLTAIPPISGELLLRVGWIAAIFPGPDPGLRFGHTDVRILRQDKWSAVWGRRVMGIISPANLVGSGRLPPPGA